MNASILNIPHLHRNTPLQNIYEIKINCIHITKKKVMKVNETGVGVAEWKNSTLKQKGNKESVKYAMKNIFQIVSTSSPTEIVVLNSLGSFSHFVTQNMSGQHRSPSEQNCSASHVHRCNKSTALSAAEHSLLFCSWVAVLFAERWEQRIADLFAQPWPPSTPYPCAGSGWHARAPPTSQIIDTGCSERCCRSVELWHWGWWAILLVGAQLD